MPNPESIPNPTGHRTSTEINNAYTIAEKRISFRRARADGQSLRKAAASANVSLTTAVKWDKLLKAGVLNADGLRKAVMSRDDALQLVTAIAKDKQSPPQVKLAAIERQARMEGWDAASRSIVEQRIVPASVMSWLQSDASLLPQGVQEIASDNNCYVNHEKSPQALIGGDNAPTIDAIMVSEPAQCSSGQQEQPQTPPGSPPRGASAAAQLPRQNISEFSDVKLP